MPCLAIQSNFYPRSPCGERPQQQHYKRVQRNFYPRSPCGERHVKITNIQSAVTDFYPRSPCGERRFYLIWRTLFSIISIHALLAESDLQWLKKPNDNIHFYPRSPCGERPATRAAPQRAPKFLSTLSLRRATQQFSLSCNGHSISIHALLAESDDKGGKGMSSPNLFLSTLSLRRATEVPHNKDGRNNQFLSTLSLRRATTKTAKEAAKDKDFYPRSPCGERHRFCPIDRG